MPENNTSISYFSYPFSTNSALVRSDGHRLTFRELSAFCRIIQMQISCHECMKISFASEIYNQFWHPYMLSSFLPNVQLQKISISHPKKGHWKCRGGGGGVPKAKILKKRMKLNWNIQGGGGSNQKTFCGEGGMDIFWNHTIIRAQWVYLWIICTEKFHRQTKRLNRTANPSVTDGTSFSIKLPLLWLADALAVGCWYTVGYNSLV